MKTEFRDSSLRRIAWGALLIAGVTSPVVAALYAMVAAALVTAQAPPQTAPAAETQVPAQEAPAAANAASWTEDFVVVVQPSAPLNVGGQIVGTAHAGDIYHATRCSGDWLWVQPGIDLVYHQPSGWIASSATAALPEDVLLFKCIRAVDPQHHAWYAARAGLSLWHARHANKPEDYANQALEDINAAIRLEPRNAQYYVSRAYIHLFMHRPSDALADCNAALEIEPQLGSAYLARGMICGGRKPYRDALPEFEQAIRCGCRSAALYAHRTKLLFTEAQWDAGFASINRAIALDPTRPPSYALRSAYWSQHDDVDKELADISTAVKLDPDDLDYRLRRAGALDFLCSFTSSVEEAGKVLEIDPGNVRALDYYAWGPPRSMMPAVMAKLESIIGPTPNKSDCKRVEYLASMRMMCGRYREAIAAYETLRTISPKQEELCYERLALLHGLLGDDEKGKAYLAQADASGFATHPLTWRREIFEPVVPLAIPQPDEVLRQTDILAEFEIHSRFAHILVPARIGGKTYRFALDTGCSVTAVDNSLRPLLGLPVGQAAIQSIDKLVTKTAYEPASIHFAERDLRTSTPMICVDIRQMKGAWDSNMMGVLGMDLLEQSILYLNCDLGKVAVLRQVPPGAGMRVPLVREPIGGTEFEGTPSVKMQLPGGKFALFKIDLGAAQGFLSLETSLFDEMLRQQSIELIGSKPDSGLSGDSQPRRIGLLASAALPGCAGNRLVVSEGNGNRIELDYWFRHIVIFDFPHNAMYVRPSGLVAASDAQIAARKGESLLWGLRGPTYNEKERHDREQQAAASDSRP